jgi:hypothetical protein
MIHKYKIGDDRGNRGGRGDKGDWGVIEKEDEACEKRSWGGINSTICTSYVLLTNCRNASLIVSLPR